MKPVLAATEWSTNADMIVDCVRLGYLKHDDKVLDATFGRGKWWSRWRPDDLTTNDSDSKTHALFNDDFRDMRWFDGEFDAITFDPPYVSIGGRDTGSMLDMHEAYGMDETPRTPAALQIVINDGIREMSRLLKSYGFCLCKVQDYVTSGKLWPGTHHTLTAALESNFTLFDRFEHVSKSPRPQPSGRRQVHARRNLSTLLVLQKNK